MGPEFSGKRGKRFVFDQPRNISGKFMSNKSKEEEEETKSEPKQ
jgi:hypothetical protein